MTTLAAYNPAALAFQASFANALNGAAFVLAAGVLGKYLNPLNAGPNAFAQLPSRFDVGVSSGGQAAAPGWEAQMGAQGRASLDLGDGYTLNFNEHNSEITIKNSNTGEETRIWGDPHVEIDGKHAFDFWGTTTFTLDNGTKITINTEQWGGNPDAYVASQVVITKGDQAVTVNGISQNTIGDLSITMSQNGRALDRATRDGYTLHENASGAGWRTEIGTIATQADLNHTRVGADYGPGSTAPSLAEMSRALSAFLAFGSMFGLMAYASALSFDSPSEVRSVNNNNARGPR